MSLTAFPADARYLDRQAAPDRPCDRCGKAGPLPFHLYEHGQEAEVSFREFFKRAGERVPAGMPTEFLDGYGVSVRSLLLVCADCHADHRRHRRTHHHGKERRR